MDDNEKIKDILACLIKHIRPDGEFYPFTNDEVEKMKENLKFDENKE